MGFSQTLMQGGNESYAAGARYVKRVLESEEEYGNIRPSRSRAKRALKCGNLVLLLNAACPVNRIQALFAHDWSTSQSAEIFLNSAAPRTLLHQYRPYRFLTEFRSFCES